MDNTEANLQNVQTYIDFVKTNLEPLAQQLKVGVDFLWSILVNQARVEAIVYLILAVSLLITTTFFVSLFFRSMKNAKFGSSYGKSYIYVHKKDKTRTAEYLTDVWEDRDNYVQVSLEKNTNREGVIAIVSGIVGGLFMITSICVSASSMPTIVTGLVNPEYRAIEKIVEFAKPAAEKAATEVKVETK